jgi:beta-glucanase (GH16 family)
MKKFLLYNILVWTLLLAASCSPSMVTPTQTPDETPIDDIVGHAPVFDGLEDISLYVGQVFYPLVGVSASDVEDGDLTSLIIVLGLENISLTDGKLDTTGTYEITYIVRDSDLNTTTVTILLNVIELDVSNQNCDFQRDGYVLTWCDDFTGIGDNVNERGIDLNKWGFQLGTGSQYGLNGWGNNEQQFYRSENASVSLGQLIIEAKLQTYGGMPYTSSRLYTKHTFAQTYGRFEALISLPVGQGLWPAFWLMPKDDIYGGWANSGEIDIMEARGRLPWEVSSALHYGGQWPNNSYTHKNYTFSNGQTISDFHLYAVEWDEDEFRFYVNDVLYHTVNHWFNTGYAYPAPFDQDFYIILNLAVGGTFDGGRLPPASLFDEPVQMIVSYVRVYQRVE